MSSFDDDTVLDESVIARYVEAGLERLERGEAVDPTELCDGHVELAAIVAQSLGLVDVLPDLHRESRAVDSRVGATLSDRYRIDARVGAGAMGAVYRARDLELDRDVAVKLMHAPSLSDEKAEQRFMRESEVLARLESEHCVTVFDRGRADDGSLFVVMELLRGVPLTEVLLWASESMPDGPSASAFARAEWLENQLPEAPFQRSFLRQVAEWGSHLATGLHDAHRCGVFHRDVKPSNIFLIETGRVLLIDFGIAARAGEGHLTATGTSIGTPWYMPPEQVYGGREPDARLDVYSLCATLYHLVTLRPPFEDDPARVLVRLQTEDPEPADRIHRGLPRDLEAILEHGMEREPARRYRDAAALAADLQAFLEHRPVSVRRLGPIGRGWRKLRRHPARATSVAAIALLAIFGLVVWPAFNAARAAERVERHDELVATLPALLSIESYPEKRLLVDSFERDDVLDLLDEILELDPTDLASRMLRAAVAIDTGRHDLARADLDAVVEQSPSPYLREVATRFANADRGQSGLDAIDLGDLPEPETPADLFVAGFHALRERTETGYDLAARALDAAGDFAPARDLRLIALLAKGDYERAYAEALTLEGVYGRKTARTRHTIGASLVAFGKYADALEPCREALELRPNRHGPWQNLGIALYRLGRVDAARSALERAHAIRPWLWNTLESLSQLHAARQEFDVAWDYASGIPESGSLGEAWRRPYAMGHVRFLEAVWRFGAGDLEASREPGRTATELFKSAARAGAPKRYRNTCKLFVSLLAKLESREFGRELTDFIRLFADDPTNPVQMRNIALLLPEALSSEQTEYVRWALLEIAAALSPGDPSTRRAADEQRAKLDSRPAATHK